MTFLLTEAPLAVDLPEIKMSPIQDEPAQTDPDQSCGTEESATGHETFSSLRGYHSCEPCSLPAIFVGDCRWTFSNKMDSARGQPFTSPLLPQPKEKVTKQLLHCFTCSCATADGIFI